MMGGMIGPLLIAVALVPGVQSGKQAPAAVQRCEALLKNKPGSDEISLCYYLQARDADTRAKALVEVQRLEEKFPHEYYLNLARAYMLRQESPLKAIAAYAEAAQKFQRVHDHTGHALCRVGRLAIFNNLGRLEDLRNELLLLDAFVDQVPNETWRVYAQAKMLRFRASFNIDIGESYHRVSKIAWPNSRNDSWWAQAELLDVRGIIALKLLDLKSAERDFLQLRELASKKGDKVKAALAWGHLAQLSYTRVELFSEHEELERAQKRFEVAIASAKSLGFYNAHSTFGAKYAALLSGIQGQAQKGVQVLKEDCIEPSEKEGNLESRGVCLAYRSQLLASSNPRAAMKDAMEAIELLATSKNQERRILGWRQLMRRSWELNPGNASKRLAMTVLETIETLRELQNDYVTRRQVFASWTTDHHWVASQFMMSGSEDPTALSSAFEVMERARARVLLDVMQGQAPGSVSLEAQEATLSTLELQSLAWVRSLGRSDTIETSASSFLGQPPDSERFVHLNEIQSLLGTDEAMLSYQTGLGHGIDGEPLGGSWVLVITRESVQALKLSADRAALEPKVRFFRDLVRQRTSSLDNGARVLRGLVLDPATAVLPNHIRSLVVLPDGPLHGLSFSAVDDHYAYSVAPSATFWAKSRQSSPDLQELKGVSLVNPIRKNPISLRTREQVGDPERVRGAPMSTPLPHSQYEVESIQRYLPGRISFLTKDKATKRNFSRLWKEHDNFIHLTAHSVVDTADPGKSALVLVEDEAGNGLLTTKEIAERKMDNGFVVLGGCSTGWGATVPGEGILSIAQAFQHAGARAVVASQWPVRDDESAIFFDYFYRALGDGHSVGEGLRFAQNKMKARNFPLSAYTGFMVLGDSRLRIASSPNAGVSLRETYWQVETFVLVGLVLLFGIGGVSIILKAKNR